VPHRWRTDKRFKRRFEKKTKEQRVGVMKCIAQVAEETPRTPGLRTGKLDVRGPHEIFYSRIGRGPRLSFHWEGPTIVFRNHCDHNEVLRNP
jgi:hypothetical protein